jgi:hypothetical protein
MFGAQLPYMYMLHSYLCSLSRLLVCFRLLQQAGALPVCPSCCWCTQLNTVLCVGLCASVWHVACCSWDPPPLSMDGRLGTAQSLGPFVDLL